MMKVFMGFPKAMRVLIVAAIYFILAVISLKFSFQSSNATPVWPPSGFAFAVLLLVGTSMAPGIFIGAFSANLFVFLSNHTCPPFTATWVSTIIGLGNTTEALAGYYLLHKFLPAFSSEDLFKKVRSIFRFGFASLIMCLTSCTIGATAVLLAGIVSPSDYFMAWFTWWAGDVSGILLLTPFIIVCLNGRWNFLAAQRAKVFETLLLVVGLTVISGIVFQNWFNPTFLFTRAFIILPLLIWAAIRLREELLTALLIVSALMAVLGTLDGVGPFIAPTLNESLLTVDAFISINSIMVLVLKAAVLETQEKELNLKMAKYNLEEIVSERTQQLEEKNKELESRNKELASFSYAASHDLQEPLRKIQTFSDKILQSQDDLSDNVKDLFRRIYSSVGRMKQLIENLLAYSKVEMSTNLFQQTDLNLVLEQVKNELSESILATNAIIDSNNLPRVFVIPFQFQQLFTNMLTNAIKFRKPGTSPHIIIESELVKGKDLLEFNIPAEEQYFHLSIRDNGIGFEQQYAEKIFEIFQRLHGQSEFEGTGIGLAICRKIIETHKGFIAATGEPGKGSCFHIYLRADNPEDEKVFKKQEIESHQLI